MKKGILTIACLMIMIFSTLAQVSEKNKKESLKAYNEAVKSVLEENYERAINYSEASISYNNAFYDAYMLKAKANVELGNIDEALNDVKLAAELEPRLGEPDYYLGYLQFQYDTSDVVLEHLNNAIDKGFKEYQVYYNRGLYKLVTGNFSGAIDDYTEAIEMKKDFPIAYHDRATAKRELGDMQGALYDYRLATNYKHDFPMAFNNMGSVKIVLGDYDGALEDYTVAINLDTSFYIAYNNRGNAKYFLGDIEGAEDDFDRALEVMETYKLAENNKAVVLAKNLDYETSISMFDKIIDADPEFAKAYLNRGLVKELVGDLEGACSDWNMAFELGIAEAEKYIKECK